MSLERNNTIPKLSDDAASKLLANVFDACEREQSTIPLETLTSYSEYRREKHGLQKVLLVIILLLFIVLPFFFIAPQFTVANVLQEDGKKPVYEVRVSGFLPVDLVAASVDGHSLTVYETGDRTYSVEPEENGTLKVKVEFLTKQYTVKEIVVDGIDNEAPVLLSNELEGDNICFYVEDTGLGIDYEGIYALKNSDTDGTDPIYPVSCDAMSGKICFAYPEESINIFIPDRKGNRLQLVVTVAE